MQKIFKRDATLGLRFAVLALVALALIVANRVFGEQLWWSSSRAVIAIPVQSVVDAPSRGSAAFVQWWTAHQTLLDHQAALIRENTLLRAQLQSAQWVALENQQLRDLHEAATHHGGKTWRVASLLRVRSSPFHQRVTVSLGAREGAYMGQPVMDVHGVMGRVVDVQPHVAEVMLLSDPQSGIPVQNKRNGVRAIVAGDGRTDGLYLPHIAHSADYRVGDVLMTSGLGGHFPAGYPVGEVVQVLPAKDQKFMRVKVRPRAALASGNNVVMVWTKGPPQAWSQRSDADRQETR